MMRGYWGFPGGLRVEHHIGGAGVAWMVLMIILWIAVIVAIVFAIRALIIHSRRNKAEQAGAGAGVGAAYPPAVALPTAASATPSLLAILEERYAKGEISRDEFLQRKQDLGLAAPTEAADVTPSPAPETGAPPQATT